MTVFAPPALRSEYRAFVSPHALENLAPQLDGDPRLLHPPGAWKPESLPPADAFGDGGSYNRMRLAMLYRGQPVRVARGPRADGRQVIEAWTLLSPYPSPDLTRLEPGTLLLVARLRAERSGEAGSAATR